MVSLTTHKLKSIAKERNIKGYKKMSRKDLLRIFDKLERFLESWTKANFRNTESLTK